jgi:hypothetical protein
MAAVERACSSGGAPHLACMATKAERYRSASERSGPKRAPRPKKRSARHEPHNEAARVSAHAGYQLEAGRAGRPSRKSTRKAANRQKAGVTLKRRESGRMESPERRRTRR